MQIESLMRAGEFARESACFESVALPMADSEVYLRSGQDL